MMVYMMVGERLYHFAGLLQQNIFPTEIFAAVNEVWFCADLWK